MMAYNLYNLDNVHPLRPLRVEGTLPSGLRGTLYRAGIGKTERFGKSVHPFLADGAITSIRIGEQVEGACQIVKTEDYLDEEKRGHSLYDSNASWLQRLRNAKNGKVKSTGNTNILSWQGRLYALMEAGKPVEFDGETLETIGETQLGVIEGAFSAHPHRVEKLKTTFNFGTNGKNIDIFALPDEGRAKKVASFEAPWASLVHDFMMTDKHAIFFISPEKLVIWRAMLMMSDFSKWFSWDENEGTMIVLIPLNTPNKPIQFKVDPFRVWHFANAHEKGDEVWVEACRHTDIGALANPVETTPDDADPELRRFRINTKTKTLKSELLLDSPCEFPMVNPHVLGSPNRYIWVQTYSSEQHPGGFIRLDLHLGHHNQWFGEEGHILSEPLFVPNPHRSEGEGWILQLSQDPLNQKSYLAVINANGKVSTPLAKLWFDHSIPMTFHGKFVVSGNGF